MRMATKGRHVDAAEVTVAPDSSMARAAAAPRVGDVPGSGRSRSLVVAAVVGIPVSIVFLVLAIRGTDLSAVWGTLQGVRPLPLLGAVALMGAVYWLQAARWRRIADTRLGQRRFFEMVVAGLAVNNVLPGRVGDLLRARWVSRGAYSGGRGLATVMLDRAFDILALVTFLLLSLPLVTDAAWVDRIVVGSLIVVVVVWVLILAARSYTRRRPRSRRAHRGLPRRFLRDTLEGLSDPLSLERGLVWFAISLAAWGTWAVGAILVGRAVGVELSLVDAIFVTAALNLGVAIPSSPGFVGTYQWLGVSALALFGVGRAEGLAFAICMQAVWYVPTTIVGAVILVAHAKGAWRSGQIFDFGSSATVD
jgi:glycosyltransferase 2 family protein